VIVRKSKYLDPEALDEGLPLGIATLGAVTVVAVSVKFDGQFRGRTVEVHSVGSDAVLAAKVESEKLSAFQSRPE
jgi:hypothetical protein